MSNHLTNLSIDKVRNAMIEAELLTRRSIVEGTDLPCVVASYEGMEFVAYIQQGQSLCFQAIVKLPQAGFRDVASHWNSNRRFTKALTHKEGYYLRSESDIAFGITTSHLSALIDMFSSSVVELFHWVQGPGPRNPLPRPAIGSASR